MHNNFIRTVSIVILLFLTYTLFPYHSGYPVSAGALTSSKVTISDSRAGQTGVSHTFTFTTATTDTIATVQMQYCTTASGACSTPSGISTTDATQGSISGLGTSSSDFSTNGTINLTVTSPVSISSGTTITLPYTGITNPITANSSFFVRLTTKNGSAQTIDSTVVAFAVLTSSSLLVTANVGATFSFEIAPITTGSVNGASVTVSDTTASTVPFGVLNSGSSAVAAHDITVTTNASNGYVVTIKSSDPPLTDSSNNIDTFTGTNASPTTWSAPAGSSANVNTGFTGYTTEDTSLCTGTGSRFSSNKWAGPETTPYEVMCNTNAVLTGETIRVGWKAEVNGIQPAGQYSGTFILVATPTY